MTSKNFDYLAVVRDLLVFSPRQGPGELLTAEYLRNWLAARSFPFVRQSFNTELPVVKSAELRADKNVIECEASSFISGSIHGKHALISSLTSSQNFLHQKNINFNPECNSISLSNYYFAPSVAIAKQNVTTILEAKEVLGSVVVTRIPHTSENILVGNLKNPRYIVIAHYDSVKLGATDNASGIAILLGLIATHPSSLKNALYVLSGNEELSYDEPVYWGHGFRELEKAYGKQLFSAQAVYVVDCVGNGPVQIYQDDHIAKLAFPIADSEQLAARLYMVSGDIDRLMRVYHSDDDGIEELEEVYLRETRDSLARLLIA